MCERRDCEGNKRRYKSFGGASGPTRWASIRPGRAAPGSTNRPGAHRFGQAGQHQWSTRSQLLPVQCKCAFGDRLAQRKRTADKLCIDSGRPWADVPRKSNRDNCRSALGMGAIAIGVDRRRCCASVHLRKQVIKLYIIFVLTQSALASPRPPACLPACLRARQCPGPALHLAVLHIARLPAGGGVVRDAVRASGGGAAAGARLPSVPRRPMPFAIAQRSPQPGEGMHE